MLHFLMVLMLMGDAQAHAQSKSYNTNLFEKEDEDSGDSKATKTQAFTAKVKVVREESDGVEVFFEGTKAKGGYSMPRSTEQYAKLLKLLEASKKPQGAPVAVTVDGDKRIKKVEKKGNDGGIVIPDDPNKMWDYGKVPE